MSLARRQQEFLDALSSSDDRLLTGFAGHVEERFDIYRNAYRTKLVDALAEVFPRTMSHSGEDAFRAAAAHHLITTPPSNWSLDQAGNGFADTVAGLFATDPEVAAIARLEWAMHIAFVAADSIPLLPADFARETADYDELAWSSMTLVLQPSIQFFKAEYDLASWWKDETGTPHAFEKAHECIVWRDGERPVFLAIDPLEAEALSLTRQGTAFGNLCTGVGARLGDEIAIESCGRWLGQWLARGWIAEVRSNKGIGPAGLGCF